MRRLILIACLAGLAAPAAAQGPGRPDITRNLPRSDEIEAMAPMLDRSVDVMLDLDVGPLIDAADPFARHRGYGRPGRTLGALGRHDDPYFEQRLRASIYGGTARMGQMMDAFAAAAPAMQRSLEQFERGIADALRAVPPHRLPPGDVDDGWDRDFDDDEAPYDD